MLRPLNIVQLPDAISWLCRGDCMVWGIGYGVSDMGIGYGVSGMGYWVWDIGYTFSWMVLNDTDQQPSYICTTPLSCYTSSHHLPHTHSSLTHLPLTPLHTAHLDTAQLAPTLVIIPKSPVATAPAVTVNCLDITEYVCVCVCVCV